MNKWIVKKRKENISLNNPILIEGLPGIGNIGKLAIDFIVNELNPELIYTIYSFNFPPSVLINEDNLISLPSVEIYRLKTKERDLLFLAGEFQPLQEEASYQFSEEVLQLAKKLGCTEIMTLGGIGLGEMPKKINIFGTATDEGTLSKYKKLSNVNFNIGGKVGAIFGATGLLLGLAPMHGIKGLGLLVETTSDLEHTALEETKLLLNTLNKGFDLNLNVKKFESELKDIEKQEEIRNKEVEEKLLEEFKKQCPEEDLNYFG